MTASGDAQASAWQQKVLNCKITCLTQDYKLKAHYQLDASTEMAEEYDVRNGLLLVRKWRRKSTLGAAPRTWDFEIGEDALNSSMAASDELTGASIGIFESSANPICVARSTKDSFEWRIRNLPYPQNVYSVTVNTEENKIVVRTSNKKYFKKIPVPEMDRLNLKLHEGSLKFVHSNNTLLVHYKKPAQVLEHEKKVLNKLKSLPAAGDAAGSGAGGPGDCAQQ